MWLMLIPVAMCVEAVVHDLKKREIPDGIAIRLVASGLIAMGLSWHSVSLMDALLGCLIGFVAVLPFSLHEGIGGGDLKLVAALGVWLGVTGTFSLLFWSALSGMLTAIITSLRGQKDFAFAPAILAGLLVTVLLPGSLETLIEGLRQF